jgi:NAD-dependent DNA ligase
MDLIDKFLKNPYDFISNVKKTELVKIIKLANNQYYNEGNPLLTDHQYDLLIDKLKKLDPKNKLLSQIGTKVHSKNKVKLPYHMGSMDKIKPDGVSISKWMKTYDNSYVISDKLDGTSALLVYKNKTKKLYTRGDGKQGTDISSMLSFINFIPDVKSDIVVRGELLISKSNFKKQGKSYVNSRAMVNGLVNKKQINSDEIKLIDFIAYELVDPYYNVEKQMSVLKKEKFNVVNHICLIDISDDYLSEYLKKRKEKGEYDIDGLIITDNGKHKRNTSGNPKYSFAFKNLLEDQIVETDVIDVEWNISKDGLIKPRVNVKSVVIDGVSVNYVTGHNAKNINDNGIGKGAKIKLTRAGEVIPYILEVIKKVKPSEPKVKFKWNSSKVDYIIDEKNNKEVNKKLLIKNMTYFVKKMSIANLDESLISRLVDNGVDSINKLIKISVSDLLKLEGFKDKLANKIYENINRGIINVDLSVVMTASNIFGQGLGDKKLKTIVSNIPNIMEIKFTKASLKERIKSIDGFEEKTALQFVENFDKFKQFMKSNPKIKLKKISKSKKGGKFSNMSFVFTGFRDKSLEELIQNEGGDIKSVVSSNTSFVITNDKDSSSSKITKAKDLNIKILNLEEFKKKFSL